MNIKTDITRQDYYEYVKFHFFKSYLKRIIISGAFALLAILYYINKDEFSLSGTISFSLAFILFYALTIYIGLSKTKKLPEKDGTILGVKDYEFGEETITFKTPKSEGSFDWSIIKKMEESPSSIYLYTDTEMAFVIPKRSFINKLETEDFKTLVKQKLNIVKYK